MPRRAVTHSSKFDQALYGPAKRAHFMVVGEFVFEWVRLEQAVGVWFRQTTGMSEDMARKVFFSSTSFNARIQVFDASLTVSELDKRYRPFLEAASSKATDYNQLRNKVVHGGPMFDNLVGSPTYGRFLIAPEKATDEAAAEDPITESDIRHGIVCVGQLSLAMFETMNYYLSSRGLPYPEGSLAQPEQSLQLVAALPSLQRHKQQRPNPAKQKKSRKAKRE